MILRIIMKKIPMKNQLFKKKFESGYQDSYFTSDIYYIDVTDALNDKNPPRATALSAQIQLH